MVRYTLPSKKNLKKAGSRQTETCHTTKADAHHHTCVSGPGSAPATIIIDVLQAIYGKDTLKHPAPPILFGTKAKQKDIPSMQIQEIAGLLEGCHYLHNGSLASLWQTATGHHRTGWWPCSGCGACPHGTRWYCTDLPRTCAEIGTQLFQPTGRKEKERSCI